MTLNEIEEEIPVFYVESCEEGGAVPYFVGPVGCGKTDTVKQFPFRMQEIDPNGSYCIVILNGATLNYGTMGGYLQFGDPYKGKPTSRFSYPWWWFETWAVVDGKLVKTGKGIDEYDGCIIFIDEADKMDQDVRKTAGAAALDHNWFSHGLPPGCSVWFAGNRLTDRSGSHKEFDHLINRRREIAVRLDMESWANWARRKLLLPEIITFGEQNPQILFMEKPVEQGPWCTPRSLAAVNKYLRARMTVYDTDRIPTNSRVEECIAGGIGAGAANKLMKTIEIGLTLPPYQDVIKAPKKVEVPTRVDLKRMQAYRMASYLKEEDTKQVLTYMERFDKEFQIIFGRMAINTDSDILFNSTFDQWCEQHDIQELIAIAEQYRVMKR